MSARLLAPAAALLVWLPAAAQENLAPNGIADQRAGAYAFYNANIYQPDGSILDGGRLLVREGRIVELGDNGDAPAGYFPVDLAGKYVYPGLIDIYTDYGIPELERPEDENGGGENLEPDDRARNANDAVRADFRAAAAFAPDADERENLRKSGFTAVLSLRPDGIARGTSALITLGDERAAESIIVADTAAHYSLDKGTSIQAMPASLMGAFALLRQTYMDAEWFGARQPRPFADAALEAWNRIQDLPQIMEVDNWQEALTADRVGDEFGVQYVLKTGGDSYRRAEEIAAAGARLIVPLDFPAAPAVTDPLDAAEVSFAALKHWELAPFNPRLLAEQGIEFSLTGAGAGDDFWPNLRQAVGNGLPAETAIAALTSVPAETLGVSDLVGRLVPGALANFLVSSGELLDADTVLLESWIRGKRHVLDLGRRETAGRYRLALDGRIRVLDIEFDGAEAEATLDPDGDSSPANIELFDDLITLDFAWDEDGGRIRLSGWSDAGGWRGNALTPAGESLSWRLDRAGDDAGEEPAVETAAAAAELPSPVLYPFSAYGRTELPRARDFVVRGATVWTNEDAGTLVADVLVRDGLIEAVGDGLDAAGAVEIDGAGKHLTPGIIDEHSHIALFNINETQTNSSMVRMRDAVDSEDINIYRNAAGGVVAAQLLHGSANPIGGQSAVVKMRWGESAPGLLIEGAAEFIKFALGENVKRSTNPASVRYPQTRMGVEQVFVNAFSQAREYGRAWDEYRDLPASRRRQTAPPRRDLVHEAMLEVLAGERFATSHSYVQSEINMLMHVAEQFDFNINTFTHILEGYKVADKMALHGAGGSTFSDWWGYKWEVRYAIPYNAALMQQAGVVVAINSDDAEMSRRLNQEAAKAIKYGDVSEVDALKMVTLNPAILMHLDDRMGSIRPGKDADLVLWSDHPLSVYAAAETTWIEGAPFYDRAEDMALREQIAAERARIIAAIIERGE